MIDKVNSEDPRPPIKLDVKRENEITPQDLAEFSEFVDRHTNSFLVMPDKQTEEAEKAGGDGFTHAIALRTLNKLPEGNSASIVFARDNSGLVGYSLVVFNKGNVEPARKVSTAFLGVREDMQRRGIGTQIAQASLEALRGMGIREYTTTATDIMINLFDKLGVKYTVQPNPNNSDSKILKISF